MIHPQRFGPFAVRVPGGSSWNALTQTFEDRPGIDGQVYVEIDFERLLNTLGRRALRSSGGKAVEAAGAVTVRKVRRTTRGQND